MFSGWLLGRVGWSGVLQAVPPVSMRALQGQVWCRRSRLDSQRRAGSVGGQASPSASHRRRHTCTPIEYDRTGKALDGRIIATS
jgi:hypothetical protein